MITVDTHVIIWDALKPELLSKRARTTLSEANKSGGLIFCEISLWEIAMLIRKRRIIIEIDYIEFIHLLRTKNKIIYKGITPEIAQLSANLPDKINLDPADRIIAATSIINNAPLVTADVNLQKSRSIKTIW